MAVTRQPIDRELMARDLALLTELLTPAIEARLSMLEPLFSMPIVGSRVRSLLSGSPRQMTSEALGRLLLLSDEDLATLLDALGRELGAWRGFALPIDPAETAELRAVYDRLLEQLA